MTMPRTALTRTIALWGPAEADAFAKAARGGMAMAEIAKAMGMSLADLRELVPARSRLHRLWLACKPDRIRRNRREAAEFNFRVARDSRKPGTDDGLSLPEDDGSGPISPELKALAAAALEAGMARRRFAAWSRAFLEMCRAKADADSGVNLVEVADALGWLPKDVYRMARNLNDRRMFPYIVKAVRMPARHADRDATDDEIVALYATAKAAREVQLPVCLRDQSRRDVLTPDYHGPTPTPAEIEAMGRQADREDVRKYLREHRRRESGAGAMHSPGHYMEAQRLGLEALDERRRRNRMWAVA